MLSGNPCIMKTHTSAHNPLTFVKTQHTSGTGLSLCKDLVNFFSTVLCEIKRWKKSTVHLAEHVI